MHTKSASGMFFVTFNNSCKSAGHYNCGYVFLTVGAGYFSCKNAARLPCGSGLRCLYDVTGHKCSCPELKFIDYS